MLNLHQKYNSTTIYESVLDNIESSPGGNSVEKIIAKEIEKKDWSVYLTIYIRDTYAQLSESSICNKIEEFFAHHPAVREFSKPQIIASDGITHLCKIGVEFYFRSMRQYVKFFYGLLSLIEYIQKERYNDDTIEVDSDSDPFDGTWRIKRATAIENLLTNAQSFDFEEDELNSYLDNVETYKTKWRLPILNESVLDNIENNDLELNDRMKTFDSEISYENQIKVQLYSNQFKGNSFDAEDKLNQLKEILDYWIPYIDGYSDLSFDAKWLMFSFYLSGHANLKTPDRMERFLLSLLSLAGSCKFQVHRALYISKWDAHRNEYIQVIKEYSDYEMIYDFSSYYPHQAIEEICKLLNPIGELFGISKEKIKTYVKNKFERDDFGRPNPNYRGLNRQKMFLPRL